MITETAWTDHGQILTETAGAVNFGVILGSILVSFWGPFWGHFRVHSGVHFGVILGSILGSKSGHFEGPKNGGPPLRNHYFWKSARPPVRPNGEYSLLLDLLPISMLPQGNATSRTETALPVIRQPPAEPQSHWFPSPGPLPFH